MVSEGVKVPDLCLPNQDDTEICLRDLLGKWIVLYFYPKDLTPGCTTQACEFSTLVPDFKGLSAIILGVSADTTKKHRDFIAKHELNITLLSDTSKETLTRFGVYREKKMCGKTCMGIVRTTMIINPEGVVVKVYDNVKAAGHAQKVKADLEALQ